MLHQPDADMRRCNHEVNMDGPAGPIVVAVLVLKSRPVRIIASHHWGNCRKLARWSAKKSSDSYVRMSVFARIFALLLIVGLAALRLQAHGVCETVPESSFSERQQAIISSLRTLMAQHKVTSIAHLGPEGSEAKTIRFDGLNLELMHISRVAYHSRTQQAGPPALDTEQASFVAGLQSWLTTQSLTMMQAIAVTASGQYWRLAIDVQEARLGQEEINEAAQLVYEDFEVSAITPSEVRVCREKK